MRALLENFWDVLLSLGDKPEASQGSSISSGPQPLTSWLYLLISHFEWETWGNKDSALVYSILLALS